jgi:hypothetical protein
MRKKLGMLADNMSVSSECETENGKCEDNEAEIDDKNGEDSKAGDTEERLTS